MALAGISEDYQTLKENIDLEANGFYNLVEDYLLENGYEDIVENDLLTERSTVAGTELRIHNGSSELYLHLRQDGILEHRTNQTEDYTVMETAGQKPHGQVKEILDGIPELLGN